MSWSLSATGKDGDEACANLADANDRQGGNLPVEVADLIVEAAALLPECKMQDFGDVSISTHGHINKEGNGTSSLTLSIAQVARH